jgi:hypothetical protein
VRGGEDGEQWTGLERPFFFVPVPILSPIVGYVIDIIVMPLNLFISCFGTALKERPW